jgi:hypothetical protein
MREANRCIANGAGVRCSPLKVFAYERLDDRGFEGVPQIHDLMLDAKFRARESRLLHIGGALWFPAWAVLHRFRVS